MSSIILQQLQLHFGDTFDQEWKVAKNYVKGLIAKNWWGDRKAMINSEGGLARMAETMLVYVLDKGDPIEGRKAYTSYLTALYGRYYDEQRGEYHEGDRITWSTMGAYSNPSAAALSAATTVDEGESSVEISPPRRGSDAERLEFLRTYRRVGQRECAAMYGITPEKARRRRDTIRRTLQKRVEVPA